MKKLTHGISIQINLPINQSNITTYENDQWHTIMCLKAKTKLEDNVQITKKNLILQSRGHRRV